jgi:copper chaperone CopZ
MVSKGKFVTEFAVSMTCDHCVKLCTAVLENPDIRKEIEKYDISLENQSILVESEGEESI